MNTIKEEMDIEIFPKWIYRMVVSYKWLYLIGNPKQRKKIGLQLLGLYSAMSEIISLRTTIIKNLKITIGLINQPRRIYGFRNVWLSDGKIIFKDKKNPSSKPLVYND